jgi:flagellar assembly factor FliW
MSESPLTGPRTLIFPDGLVGYPDWQHFELERSPDGSPVAWLQGKDEEEACFVVTEPSRVCPTYAIDVPAHVRAALGLGPDQEPSTLCMLVIQPEPLTITANLLGPIVYNPDTGLACQMVLAESRYSARHPVVVADAGVAQGGPAC